MKKLISKVLTFVLMLAMVVTAVVIPNEQAKAATDYYVAGEGSTFGGWNAADPKMKMTQDGDVYKLVIKDVPAGGHAFKVTDGSWTNSWGKDGGNDNYTVETASVADMTIIFNPSTKAITVESAGLGAASYPDRYFAGEHNSWNVKDDSLKLTENADGSFSITIKMAAGKQDFKITNGTWGKTWPTNNYELTLDVESNVTITVTKDGEVEVKKVAVENPAPAPETTYHVVGLGGDNDWSDTDANKMTLVDGNYVFKKTLAPASYEYKVHSSLNKWIPDGDNLKVTVETECEVTFTYNPTTGEVTATGTGVANSTEKFEGYFVLGTMNNWTTLSEYKMSEVGDGYTLTINMEVGNYEFKIKKEGAKVEWYPAENVKFEVVKAGKVTFSVDAEGAVKVYGDALEKDAIDPAGDINMVLPLALVLFGGAIVFVASKKRFA